MNPDEMKMKKMAEYQDVVRRVVNEMKAREGRITDADCGGSEKRRPDQPAFDESAGQCCGTQANPPTPLIPSLLQSLHQELAATRETVAGLATRLAPVLSASKKDVCSARVGQCFDSDGPSLANDLSALGNGFYNERQGIEDLLARLEL
jgi:hypothetical protein